MKDGKAAVKEAGCIGCGHCYAICPKCAVSIEGMSIENGELVSMTEFDSDKLLQAMKSRRTIRSFLPKQIDQAMINQIIEAGRYCPTGSNAQDVGYTILGSKQNEIEALCVKMFRKGLNAAGSLSAMARNITVDDHFFFKGAPLVIVVSGKGSVNASLASSYMEMMAESLGLGVLYSGFFVACSKLSRKVRKLLDVEKGKKVITCLVIGYPAVHYQRIPGRKPVNLKKL